MIKQSGTPLAEALRSCRSPLASAFILSVFVNLTLFAAPLYSMQIYDRVLTSLNLGTLAMLTLIVAVFVGLYGFLEYVRAGVLVRAGVRFHEELARPTFEAAMRAQLAGRHAAAAQAARDADSLRDALSTGTVSTLFDVRGPRFSSASAI
jgi:ATP-binding cassette subfamily C protein/ATP-binding cassette subfamily C protein EexD